MSKYHISKNGEPAICKARVKCPLAGADEHYNTPAEAREAYEESQSGELFKIHTIDPRGEFIMFPSTEGEALIPGRQMEGYLVSNRAAGMAFSGDESLMNKEIENFKKTSKTSGL